MPIRLRKFIGTIVLILFVMTYALVAMVIAEAKIVQINDWTKLLYFAIMGLAWIVPAGGIIWWMERKPKADQS